MKIYDLENRTLIFTKSVLDFVRKANRDIPNLEIIRQVVRSSGSIGANYIEANESLSKKDFLMRVKICRKEAKETRYWLELIDLSNNLESTRHSLINEVTELMKIFGSILEKSK